MDLHTCTREELGLDENNLSMAKFMPVHRLYRNALMQSAGALQCVDNPDELRLQGTSTTDIG